MSLLGRRAKVLIDTLSVEGLDVSFDVTLQADNLGKATIQIYNLNRDHRSKIASVGSVDVSLSVCYIGYDLTSIFKGEIREASSRREGPDWITSLKSGDGDKVSAARVAKSYPPGASFDDMWKDAVKAVESAGIKAGNALEAFRKGVTKDGITTLLSGGVLQGPALKELRRLSRLNGLSVDIQNEELVVVPFGEPLDAEAIVLSPSSGLVGSPERAADSDGAMVLKARSLIVPGLLPRRKVRIKSDLVDALYVVRKVQYKGDTAAQEWYADMECTAL